ncbi:MAG: toll/interleukin-1 receptor domain-containing protein [Bacteroidota bacterium]
MADIFISYSSDDKTIVRELAALLEDKGWSVWWDRQIPIGQKYDTVIETELQNARCVLVIWTQRSINSEWVKNEALEAAQKNKLVPVELEQVALPLAFKRIESSLLFGWTGDRNHPELPFLYTAIDNILHPKASSTISKNNNQDNNTIEPKPVNRKAITLYSIIAGIGLIGSIAAVYYYLHQVKDNGDDAAAHAHFYPVLILFGVAIGALIYGSMNTYAVVKQQWQDIRFKIAGPVTALFLILLGGFFLHPHHTERIITIRIFDWKKTPITDGEVKIYLNEYIRTQSIDKMGQALFTGIPAEMASNKMKIEVSSPGYATKHYDTLLVNEKPLELILPLTTVVFISGKVKTAAEMPIKGVEINVDGTRYYAMSITDGTYNLRLEEYTLGDEINITTSHPDYEDKTISLRINAPDIKNEDIFLNPAKKN